MHHLAEYNTNRIHDRFRCISEHSRWKSISATMPIIFQYTTTASINTDLPLWIAETLTSYRDDNHQVHHKDRSNTTHFYIVSGNGGNLLSFTTAENLGILHMIRKIASKVSIAQIVSNFPEVFKEGIGKICGQPVKLPINPEVIPKQQPHHRIPFHTWKDIEKELERLERLDIIEKADGPTPWLSPIVAVSKKNGRVCI